MKISRREKIIVGLMLLAVLYVIYELASGSLIADYKKSVSKEDIKDVRNGGLQSDINNLSHFEKELIKIESFLNGEGVLISNFINSDIVIKSPFVKGDWTPDEDEKVVIKPVLVREDIKINYTGYLVSGEKRIA
ncbi:MAG: hypothetical protein ACRC37_06210, partial [Lentisphaeria bacterium]